MESTEEQPETNAPEVLPERQNAAATAVEAAAAAALEMPGVPGRDEFLALAMQARILSMSGAAPAAIRGNPHVAFHVAMIGRDLGISPSAACELVDVVNTSAGPRISLSPQLINGQVRRLRLGAVVPVERTNERAVARAIGPDGSILGESEFTWEDAREAGLVGAACEPGKHGAKCGDRQSAQRWRCNQGYITYPKRMLWWRAAGFCADDYFPEASLGLYTPEALGAVVDVEGRPVDPATVELPEGYELEGRAEAETVDPERVTEIVHRVQALPQEWMGRLRDQKAKSEMLRGQLLAEMDAAALRVFEAMLRSIELQARRAGWGPPATSPDSPLDAPESASKPESEDRPAETVPEPPEGAERPERPERPSLDVDDAHHLSAKLAEVADAIPPDEVEAVVAEVKAMHHAVVDRELRERGYNPEGRHIDVRRLALTCCLSLERALPNKCRIWDCEEFGDDGYCDLHSPF